ncbi:MAG: DUF512 domain-containing protein [Clostridiales bacterium]|nr:DUF512 domain-containing protein [Clostridiales bacterium]
MRHKIIGVDENSICAELGIKPGDILVAINDQPVRDLIDYQYYDAMDELTITIIEKDTDEAVLYEIEKYDYEHLGLKFENDLLTMRSCANKCIFCFVDQLPPNMRKTLYVKDDDWRMSVLFGNYVTLTNVSEREIQRIIDQHISPLYISVHATDVELRRHMLGNPKAQDIMAILRRFAEAEIYFHTQIVLCPEINDGFYLRQTFEDLFTLYPYCQSLAVVPVGLTYHRKKLHKLKKFNSSDAKHIVEEITKWQESCLEFKGSRFIYPSDEFYVQAKLPIPNASEYEDFMQIENGVGMLAKFKQEVLDYIPNMPPWIPDRKVSIATGVSSADFMKEMVDILNEHFPNLTVNIFPITNFFFGESVTVTGLLTGRDIAVQLDGKDVGSEIFICNTMLRGENGKFLDDLSVNDVENWINKKITPIDNLGSAFVQALLGIKEN